MAESSHNTQAEVISHSPALRFLINYDIYSV